MNVESFGTLPDGREAHLFTLSNNWMEAKLTNYGGTLTSIMLPDRNGIREDILLGFDSLEGCLSDHPFMNTLIGRFGNRIAHGRFQLDGKEYQLPLNLPPHHLHGGSQGLDKVLWDFEDVSDENGDKIKLTYLSPDGEMGYPGNLQVSVTFSLTPKNELGIRYEATTDQPTVVNLTHHGYFNLSGRGDIRAHELCIEASQIVAADGDGIPLADAFMNVEGTPFDFRQRANLGDRLMEDHEQIRLGGGFDRSFVIDGWNGELRKMALVEDPGTGRFMEMWTDQPAVQLYTANFLEGVKGKGGVDYKAYMALCLETQHFPDSPNRPDFPSTVLRPGEVYKHETIHRFGAK